MKIIISQPMNGRTNKEIKDERAELVHKLEEEGHEVIDTIFDDFECATSPITYLIRALKCLDEADGIIFMKDWENARGCIIEYEVAKRYGKWIKECE